MASSIYLVILASIFSLSLCLEPKSASVNFLINADEGFLGVRPSLPKTATYLNYTGEYADPVKNAYTTDVQFGSPIQNTTGYNFVIDTTVKSIMAIATNCDNCTYNKTYDLNASSTEKNLTEIVP